MPNHEGHLQQMCYIISGISLKGILPLPLLARCTILIFNTGGVTAVCFSDGKGSEDWRTSAGGGHRRTAQDLRHYAFDCLASIMMIQQKPRGWARMRFMVEI